MKSRWTTYVLLAVVLGVWGAVAWKIFDPGVKGQTKNAPPSPTKTVAESCADTLLCNYSDPFLKGVQAAPASRPMLRALPKKTTLRRERFRCEHKGTMASGKRVLYILAFGETQYELSRGESAEGFTLRNCDRDSLYLEKDGLVYGVRLCD